MSIIDELRARAENKRAELLEREARVAESERAIAGWRDDIAALQLEVVECLTAANFLEQAGFVVDRTGDGIPRVSVQRTLEPEKPA